MESRVAPESRRKTIRDKTNEEQLLQLRFEISLAPTLTPGLILI